MLFINVLKIRGFRPLLLVLDTGDLPGGTKATPRAPNLGLDVALPKMRPPTLVTL